MGITQLAERSRRGIDGNAALLDGADADRQWQHCGIRAVPVTEHVRQAAVAVARHLDRGRADREGEILTPGSVRVYEYWEGEIVVMSTGPFVLHGGFAAAPQTLVR